VVLNLVGPGGHLDYRMEGKDLGSQNYFLTKVFGELLGVAQKVLIKKIGLFGPFRKGGGWELV